MPEAKKTQANPTQPVRRKTATAHTQPIGVKRVSSSKAKSKQGKSWLDWLYVPVKSDVKTSKNTTRYEAPGVMMRGTPMVRKTKSSTRRQQPTVYPRRDYNLPNNPGTITLPSLPRLNLSWRILSLFLAAALGVGLYFAWTSTLFQIQDLEISGLKRLSGQDIQTVLDVRNQPSFLLDPQALQEDLLLQFPELITATVQVGFPNTLAITVTERLPVLVWEQGGRTNLVDAEGMAFPARGEAIDPSLPQVIAQSELANLQVLPVSPGNERGTQAEVPQPLSALQARKILDPEVVAAVLILRDHSPEGAPLIYSAEHGFGWEDAGGWQVYFGDAGDIQMKLRIYQSILRMLDEKDVLPSLVSVEWVHAPYYRVE